MAAGAAVHGEQADGMQTLQTPVRDGNGVRVPAAGGARARDPGPLIAATAQVALVVTSLGLAAASWPGGTLAHPAPPPAASGPYRAAFVAASLSSVVCSLILLHWLREEGASLRLASLLGLALLPVHLTLALTAGASQYALLPRLLAAGPSAATPWYAGNPASVPFGLVMLADGTLGAAAVLLGAARLLRRGRRTASAMLLALGLAGSGALAAYTHGADALAVGLHVVLAVLTAMFALTAALAPTPSPSPTHPPTEVPS